MTAHVRYPALDPKDGATVSRAILTDLLRGELGFKGFAVTDSLDMKGITDVEAPDQVVTRAIAAGADAAMVTTGLDRQLAAAGWIDAGVDAARVQRGARARDRLPRAVRDRRCPTTTSTTHPRAVSRPRSPSAP